MQFQATKERNPFGCVCMCYSIQHVVSCLCECMCNVCLCVARVRFSQSRQTDLGRDHVARAQRTRRSVDKTATLARTHVAACRSITEHSPSITTKRQGSRRRTRRRHRHPMLSHTAATTTPIHRRAHMLKHSRAHMHTHVY